MLFGLGTCKRDNNYSFVKLFDYNNVAKDRKIAGIYFLDDTTVFLLGEDNRDVKKVYQNPQALLLRTFDGGKTFRYGYLGEGKLTCFNYSTDLKNIYMVKEHYIIEDKIHKISDILHSSDMGNSWEKVYSFSEKTILNLEFFNDSLGSITLHERGNLQLYKTKDGGKSWHKLNNPLLDGGIANVIDVKGMLWGIYSTIDNMIWKMDLRNDTVCQVSIDMPSDYVILGSLQYDVTNSYLYLSCREKDFNSNCHYMIYCVNDGRFIDFNEPIIDFNVYGNYIGIVSCERDNDMKSTYYYSTDSGNTWNKELPKCRLLSECALYGKGNFWSIAEYGDSILWPLMIRAVPNDNNTIVDSQKKNSNSQ